MSRFLAFGAALAVMAAPTCATTVIDVSQSVSGGGAPFYTTAVQHFTVPAGFQLGFFHITDLHVDGSAYVLLNGLPFFGWADDSPSDYRGAGYFYFDEIGPAEPVRFTRANGLTNQFIVSPFRVGDNTLQMVVNATQFGMNVGNLPISAKPSTLRLSGDVRYSLPGDPPPTPVGEVPEPTQWAMMITGFALVGYAKRRRQRGARVVSA